MKLFTQNLEVLLFCQQLQAVTQPIQSGSARRQPARAESQELGITASEEKDFAWTRGRSGESAAFSGCFGSLSLAWFLHRHVPDSTKLCHLVSFWKLEEFKVVISLLAQLVHFGSSSLLFDQNVPFPASVMIRSVIVPSSVLVPSIVRPGASSDALCS